METTQRTSLQETNADIGLPTRDHCEDGVLSFAVYHKPPEYSAIVERWAEDLADVAMAWREGGAEAAQRVAERCAEVAWLSIVKAGQPETTDAFVAGVDKTTAQLVRAGLALLSDYYAHFE